MNKIKLPPLNWFIQEQNGQVVTNTYSGSLGTDAKTGCLGQPTFNYRVFAELLGDAYKLAVKICIPKPLPNDDCLVDASAFEATADGLAEAETWIGEISETYGF